MTATRWWVKLYARWIARIKAVQGQLNLFFTALSGTSLASGALRYFGAPTWAIILFLLLLALVIVTYTYLYSEGGVWNQSRRDERDMSMNYIDPRQAMNQLVQAEQRAILAKAIQEEWTEERIEREMHDATVDLLQEYRDGIDVNTLENGQQERSESTLRQ